MIEIQNNISLRDRNTFGMDVSCSIWIDYDSPNDLDKIYETQQDIQIKSIGEGSNLLFTEDFNGILLHSKIGDIIYDNHEEYVDLCVGAGVKMDYLVAQAVKRGLWGIENLSGIPGTVGAAAVQNIGAYGCEIKDVITEIAVFDTKDLQHKTLKVGQCKYAYRSSIFKHGVDKDRYVVYNVSIRLSRSPKPNLQYGNLISLVGETPSLSDIRKAVIKLRDSKLPNPALYGNAGSFFMNPVISMEKFEDLKRQYPKYDIPHFLTADGIKVPAAWLIDKAGWKGKTFKGAAVWEKQPLVLVNKSGDATPQDIIGLRDAIIIDVESRYGITLHPEVEEIK